MELLDADSHVLATSRAGTLRYYTKASGTFYVRFTAAATSVSESYLLRGFTAADPFEEHEHNDTFEDVNSIWLRYSFFHGV